uniref:Transmembrane protein 106 N-terminal domain-containing protein n=1 Tax=Oryzias latipes TaxID=8090 RepID=A0A3P9K062_ORYLA
MGTLWSRRGSSVVPSSVSRREVGDGDSDDESLDGLVRREDIAQFPYVEFTGRDSITCPTCQGTGRIPSEQVNELVALIPYSDQRLQPQRTKLYVGLSVLLCLLVSSLVAFFLFPRSVVVEDAGLRSVTVRFDHLSKKVLMNMTRLLHHAHQGPQHRHLHANHRENLLHGQDIPEQPGIVPLHRLRRQHHLPPDGGPAPAPPFGLTWSHCSSLLKVWGVSWFDSASNPSNGEILLTRAPPVCSTPVSRQDFSPGSHLCTFVTELFTFSTLIHFSERISS